MLSHNCKYTTTLITNFDCGIPAFIAQKNINIMYYGRIMDEPAKLTRIFFA